MPNNFTFSHHPGSLHIPLKELSLPAEATISPKWPRVRKKWLQEHPNCAICGTNISLNVHHIKPFHLFPELELDPNNFITLCEGKVHTCHYVYAHMYNWEMFNPTIKEDAVIWSQKFADARAVLANEQTKKQYE